MANTFDRTRSSVHAKQMPKDVQVIVSLLKEINIDSYEPAVVPQLLHFCSRYITTLLDEAKVIALHARKKTIDSDDMKLAMEFALDKCFTRPPPREIIAKLSEARNSMPLPPVKQQPAVPNQHMPWQHRCNLPMKVMNRSALGEYSMVKMKSWHEPQNSFKLARLPLFVGDTVELTIPKPTIELNNAENKMETTDLLYDDKQAAATATAGAVIELNLEEGNKADNMEIQLIDVNAAMSGISNSISTAMATNNAALDMMNVNTKTANAVAVNVALADNAIAASGVAGVDLHNDRVTTLKRKHDNADNVM